MGKHVVCSGCSFTRQQKRLGIDGTDIDFLSDDKNFWRWPHHLQEILKDDIIYNLGNPTNDNNVILLSIITKINELIKKGIDTNDIYVIVQWSDANRKSYFISKDIGKQFNSDLKETLNSDDAFSHVSAYLGDDGYYILSGGYNYDHVPYNVVDVFDSMALYSSTENFTIEYCKNILFLQNFCKIHKISNFHFNLSFNFLQPKYTFEIKDIYIDKKVPKSYFNKSYENQYIHTIFEQIDLDKVWLYEDGLTNHGGIMEWAIRVFDEKLDKQLFMEHDTINTYKSVDGMVKNNPNMYPLGHPSEQMNKKFVENVILKNFFKKNLE